jgi:hypothetical protein
MIADQGTLNSLGLYTTFGLQITDGIKRMEDAGDLKETETYNWPEMPGLEYSPAPIVYQDTDVDLDVFIIGTSVANIINKKNLLKAEFMKPGFKALAFALTGHTYNVRLKKMSPLIWYGSGSDQIAKFTLTVIKCFSISNQTITTILDGNG